MRCASLTLRKRSIDTTALSSCCGCTEGSRSRCADIDLCRVNRSDLLDGTIPSLKGRHVVLVRSCADVFSMPAVCMGFPARSINGKNTAQVLFRHWRYGRWACPAPYVNGRCVVLVLSTKGKIKVAGAARGLTVAWVGSDDLFGCPDDDRHCSNAGVSYWYLCC